MGLRKCLLVALLFFSFSAFKMDAWDHECGMEQLPVIVCAEEIKREIFCKYEERYCKAYGGCTYEHFWYVQICYKIKLNAALTFTVWLREVFKSQQEAYNLYQCFTIQPGDRIAFNPVCRMASGGVFATLFRDESIAEDNYRLLLFGPSIINGKKPPKDW